MKRKTKKIALFIENDIKKEIKAGFIFCNDKKREKVVYKLKLNMYRKEGNSNKTEGKISSIGYIEQRKVV